MPNRPSLCLSLGRTRKDHEAVIQRTGSERSKLGWRDCLSPLSPTSLLREDKERSGRKQEGKSWKALQCGNKKYFLKLLIHCSFSMTPLHTFPLYHLSSVFFGIRKHQKFSFGSSTLTKTYANIFPQRSMFLSIITI